MSVKSRTSDFFIKNWFLIFSMIVSGVTAYNMIKDHEKRISKLEEINEEQTKETRTRLREFIKRER